MSQSFIAFNHNKQPLQPLLKVEQGFKNSAEIQILPNTDNSITFYLCCKNEKSNKGSIVKIAKKNIHSEKEGTIRIIASIPSENEFSVIYSTDDENSFSIPEIIKLPDLKLISQSELPYGTFVYQKPQEATVIDPIDAITETQKSDEDFSLPDEEDFETGASEIQQTDTDSSNKIEISDDLKQIESPDENKESIKQKELESSETVEEKDEYYELAEKAAKVQSPLSLKLIGIISMIVIIALGSITALVSYFVTSDVRISAEENNMTINSRSASDTENRLDTIYNNAQMMLELISSGGDNTIISTQAIFSFFAHNDSVVAVYIPGIRTIENTKFFISNGITAKMSEAMIAGEQEAIQNAEGGATRTINVSPYYGLPIAAAMLPITIESDAQPHALVILFSTDSLADIFNSDSINSSFIVNNEGYVVSHPDTNLVLVNADMSSSPLVSEMKVNSDTNKQMLYTDSDGTEFFGAYRKIPEFGLSVITIVESKSVFESIRATTRRNIYLSIAVLFLSVMFIWFFAKSITTPIKALAAASRKIANGDFDIHLLSHTHDEIGLLTTRFTQMRNALDAFGKFTNKQIAVKAMKGEITLGGETKTATLFFSDIRSFTAISEKLTAEEVVFFLNDYMTRMVACVEKTGGTVDKFIGDAVMAHWGAASSTGTAESDAISSLRAALMMRAALREFNIGRGGDRKPIIRIGCGINTGLVVAGQIGSNDRMEYTCIGDTVNFASRTESLNKPLGTDILMTENTYNLVKDEVLVEQMPSVTVKGKEKPVHMYALINMPEADDIPGAGKDGPKTLQEVRNLLGIPTPDLTGVNLDEDEKKYKIQGN